MDQNQFETEAMGCGCGLLGCIIQLALWAIGAAVTVAVGLAVLRMLGFR